MLWTRPFTASGAITKNRLVEYGADDTHVSMANAGTDRIAGVYIGPADAADGDAIEICILGECNLEVSGAIARGMRLTTNASGQGISAEGTLGRNCAMALISGTTTTIPAFIFPGPQEFTTQSAYTQTYSTADKTHANFTSSDLTGIASSTTGSALAEPSAAYTQAEQQQNFRRIQDQHNAVRADLTDLKQLVNSVIDDLQALKLVG